jgi:hypothetical protein
MDFLYLQPNNVPFGVFVITCVSAGTLMLSIIIGCMVIFCVLESLLLEYLCVFWEELSRGCRLRTEFKG